MTKRFPGVVALDEVTFEAERGRIHALVGENGAGKSTLMAIAAGSLKADTGTVHIAGIELDAASPEAARALGLAIVRQRPALLPDLTVAENIGLVVPGSSMLRAGSAARALLREWNPQESIDPGACVNSLTPEQSFVVEIAKALAQRPKVLILDEPTEHLRADDVARLFAKVRELASNGTAVVYISHRIHEVREIADRITVLRDGRVRATFGSGELSEQEIVNLIAGRPLDAIFPPKRTTPGDVVLRVSELSGTGFTGVNLELRHGEIVGLAGIEGNGQREFLRALAGLTHSRGAISVRGRPNGRAGTRAAARENLAYIPADRHREGIIPEYNVRANLMLRRRARSNPLGLLSRSREAEAARRLAGKLRVKAPSLETPVSSLSGGNQQKIVLSSALAIDPAIVLADEPTQGVDVGTRTEIYRHLRASADDGTAVIVLSADALELAGLCDRVLVFSRGTVVAELEGEGVTEARIATSMLTSTAQRSYRHRNGGRFRRWLAGHTAPMALVALAIVALGVVAATVNAHYLSENSIAGILAVATTLALVSCGQQLVMLTGGIDLSVGPLMGLVVVIESFYLVDGATALNEVSGWTLVGVVAALVGAMNWAMIDIARLSPIVATLAMFMALQAVSLILRPVPDGYISGPIIDTITTRVGFLPLMLVAAALLAVALEAALLWSKTGVRLRAVGSDEAVAATIGIRDWRYRLLAYVGCSLLAGLAAIPLMAQIGTGDPAAGLGYMLTSIAAVAVGGASIFGGRGSFIGTVLGALLLSQVTAVTAFVQLDTAWNWYLLGLTLIVAVAAYSKSRELSVSA